MPFLGVLKQATAFTVEVDNSNNADPCAYTILRINKKDKIASADHQTIPGTQLLTFTETAAAGIDRVIVYINPTRGMSAAVRVIQGTVALADPCVGDTQLVFNATP